VADFAKAIENYRWAEFEARLDVHHASLIQHREAKALDSSVRIAPSLAQGGHDLLALWVFIRLASQFCTMLNTIVCFSCLGDRAPCLLDAVDSFSSRSFNPTLRWISMCYSSKFACFGTQQFLVLYWLSCISSCNVFVAGLCWCFSAMSLHF